jgi:ribulose-bisphosphate carboxylase large chain
VRSLHQAWEAAILGVPLAEYATKHAELKAALDKFAA